MVFNAIFKNISVISWWSVLLVEETGGPGGPVVEWQLDLQLPMQSVPITTDVVSSNLDQGEAYNIM
jgi:hypothetical protein